jgi:transposase
MDTTCFFFEDVLGVKTPWHIVRVDQDQKRNRVDLYVEHQSGIQFPCPTCKQFCSIYDHAPERELRHLNVCQRKTYIHVRIPRIECTEHGIQQIVHGLAENNGTVTYEFEKLVIDLEQECSLESVDRLIGVDWHLSQKIQERAVQRGFERKPVAIPQRIGVDEKSFSKGHKYETIVHNIDTGTVEYVCDDREQKSLEAYYKKFTPDERACVEAVTMDMWDPYIAATRAYIPDAKSKIVFDRYHVMKYVVDAVDKVRKQEHAELKEDGCEMLKGTKYLFLWSQENIPEWRREEFDNLRSKDLKVCRAWAIKENIRHLWEYYSEGWMRKYFAKWYWWATHSRLEPMKKAAHTLKGHIENIVTYAKHHITNALGESLNSKIEKVKRLACGYRNRAHYRTAIYFHCGGLDLFPKRSNIALQVIST